VEVLLGVIETVEHCSGKLAVFVIGDNPVDVIVIHWIAIDPERAGIDVWDTHVVSSAKLACDIIPRALTVADAPVLWVDPMPDEITGSKLGIVASQPRRIPRAGIGSGPGCDDTDHLGVWDHFIVLTDDDPIGIDKHADPVLVGVDLELRDDMEAETPAQ
jgi:hypothetical protein